MLSRWSPQTVGIAAVAASILGISVVLAAMPRGGDDEVPPVRYPGSNTVRPLPSLLAPARLPSRVRVTIVRDFRAAEYYTRAAELDTIIASWRRALAATGAEVRIARSAGDAAVRAAQVLVIPASPCLTLETRAAIEAAGARGQGLILSGLVGTHDAGCREIGFGLMADLTGASRIERVEQRAMVYVTVPDGSPLSVHVPPGARLDVNPARPLALRHPRRAAYYSDYSLVPRPADDRPLLDGALVATTTGRTRLVYWGFEPRDVVASPWNRAIASLLVRNSLAWAARLPLADVEPWPWGRVAAAVLTQDVEDRFANARHALDSLRAAGVPSTFFLTSNLARRHRGLVRDIAEAGEVATHSENHWPLAGNSGAAQRERLALTRRDLAELVDRPVLGLRPPREEFDRATLAAWAEAGGHYLFGANDSRVAAPELLAVEGDTLVLFGRVTHDDFAAIGPRGAREPDELADVLLGEMGKVRALGGLYLLSYHSQLMSRPDQVPALARLARAIAADTSVWLTTAGDVAAWWRARAALEVQVRERAGGALDLTVRNSGAAAVEGVVLRVVHGQPYRLRTVDVRSLPSETGAVRLALPALPPGASRVIRLVSAASRDQ